MGFKRPFLPYHSIFPDAIESAEQEEVVAFVLDAIWVI
jgi:hypothetical protein